MKNSKFEEARKETNKYHEQYYSDHDLFESGSWLSNPDYELEAVIEELKHRDKSKILDIGAGVGRNAIALALALKDKQPTICCLDSLSIATAKLLENATKYEVESSIKGITENMDDMVIAESLYDCILSVSVLEHSASYDIMINTIEKIINGTKSGGINRLTFSTNRTVKSLETGKIIESPVETELERDKLIEDLKRLYACWEIILLDTIDYDENLDRNGEKVNWKSSDLSFLARKVER